MEKYFNKLKNFLLIIPFVLTGFQSFSQFSVSVYPLYGQNQLHLYWTAVTGAQAYATRIKTNAGAYSGWDSMGNTTVRDIVVALNTSDTWTVQVRARRAGIWDTLSDQATTNAKTFWPVKNTAGTGPSRNLMHDFCQPIQAGGSIYLHEGCDINGDYATPCEQVVAAFSGYILSVGQGSTGKYLNVKVSLNGNIVYYQYNHMKNLNPRLIAGDHIMAGDSVGHIVDSFWNTNCYHVHFHHWVGSNMVTGTKHPLSLFSDNADKDPADHSPVTLNTNNDGSYFKLRQAASTTYLPKDTVAYNAVDIVWEILDRKSDSNFYQNPEKVGYYIEKMSGGGWSSAVRSAASPYILYHNDEFLSTAFGSTPAYIENAMFDNAVGLKSSQPTITPKPAYDFEQWFTWILTNTKGTSGHKTDFDVDQCWATNARNTVDSANGYTLGYDEARAAEEAKFPDGFYKVTAVASDFVNDVSFSKIVTVDNFKPYVKNVSVYSGTTKIYEGKWDWSSGTGQYLYTKVSDSKAACNDSIKVVVKMSEAMSSVDLAVADLSYTKSQTHATDTAKTTWEFMIPATNVKNNTKSKQKMEISGLDLNNEGIVGFQNDDPLSWLDVPTRNADGSWNPSTAAISDKSHTFRIDSLDHLTMIKEDVKCAGKSTGMVKVVATGGTAPYTYEWDYGGRTTQTITGVPAGTYKVTVKDNNECKGKGDTIVDEKPDLSVSIVGGPAVIPFCIQDGAPNVTLTATATGGTLPYTYSWPGRTKIINSTGIYTVNVTDSNTCTADASTFMLFIPVLCSRDPNDIAGPEGYSTPHFVSKTETMPYTIRFENDPNFATAPAQKVVVTLPFHAKHDMYTFRLKSFGFGDFTFNVPNNKTSYSTRLDVKDSLGVYVDFIAGIDPTKGEAFWIFESIDPATGLPPADPTKGFLPINDLRHRGEGFVSFTVNPKSSSTSGDSVTAMAKIVFDVHSPIYTNKWYNIIDAVAPSSKADSLPTNIDSNNIRVSWKGKDDTKGSGIANYEIYYSENNNAFQLFRKDVADTSILFSGNFGSSYRFYTRAKDNVGNKEGAKTTAEATTRIKPFRIFNKPDSNSFYCKGSEITINWKKIDIAFINLKFSSDSGKSWHLFASALDINDSVYKWTMPDSLPSNQYYQLLATNSDNDNPLTNSDFFFVSNHPSANAGTDKNLCPGTSVSLGGSPTAGGTIPPYQYTWTPASSLNNDSTANPLSSPSVNTLYKLVVTDSIGCSSTDSVWVRLRPAPVAIMQVSDTLQCFNNNLFNFKNISTLSSGTLTKTWKFGDGSVSTADSVSHSYGSSGIFSARLIVHSDFGCADSVSKSIEVKPQPQASFSINDSSQCNSSDNFIFTNNSTGAASNHWDFGDASTSTVSSPSHSYSSSGTYIVKLVCTSLSGCKDSITKTVYVRPQPVAGFSINNNDQCRSGNNFVFTNSSSGSSTYFWSFGDATTSSIASPSHSYSAAGTYNVKLVSTSAYGCKDSLTLSVTVRPQPVAGFSINNNEQCLSGNSFVFTNSSTAASTYLWNFGDVSASTATSPVHSYLGAGAYSVKLVSTSAFGCKDSVTLPLTVRPQPVAGFSVNSNDQCLSANNFIFTNSSTGSTTYNWTFGDASVSTGNSPSHAYSTAGSYIVKLVSVSAFGCKDSLSSTVIVRPQPVAGFSVNSNSQCLSGNNFVFTNSSSGGSIYLWDFGDVTSSTTTSPSHTYLGNGTFTVKLVTTSSFGCKDSSTLNINVRPQPVAGFTVNNNDQCLSGNSFVFTNGSAGASTYTWNFGDAATSTGISPLHSYSAAGTYTIKLVSVSAYNCKDSTTLGVTVRTPPIPGFSINNNDQCLSGNSFVFTNSSTAASTYSWDFGDAATSTATSPSHSYSTAGTYTVKLVSYSTNGCKDSITRTLTVRPLPIPGFSINNNEQCFSTNSFIFTNNTTGASTYRWDFGDAGSSTSVSPAHSYTSTGAYTIKLVATSSYGCKDSITGSITVRPQPYAGFNINNNDQCLSGNSFVFTNSSSGAATYSWNFGDAAASTATSPSHSYTTTGTYSVKLVSTSTYGCKDSATLTLTVRPQPATAFSMNNNDQCYSGNSFVFTNNTAGAVSYSWSFGDAGTSTSASPSHSYTASGTYTVKLVSTSSYGCKDSVTHTLTVRPQPVAGFTINNNSQCLSGNSFVFTNSSAGAATYNWYFGDAGTSTSASPTHSYTTAGTFTVKQVSISTYGCKDSTTQTLTVRPLPVTAFSINNNDQCLTGNSFVFTNSTTGASTYSWNFGDAGTSTSASPSHSYATAGTFTVKLVSTSTYGCKDSTTHTLTVRPLPVPAFTINNNDQCFSGNSFVFTNGSTGAATYSWNFGDAATSTANSPSHSYSAAGTYTVKLVSTSSYGCKDSITRTVTIRPQPVAGFTISNNDQCLSGNSFVFSNSSSGAATYSWNFGDAATSTAIAPSHSYSIAGTFSVKLVSTSSYGCKDSITRTLTVRPQPVTAFTINNNDQCLSGNSFVFSNSTTGAVSYSWNFGDAGTSTSNSPSHSYSIAGTYAVKLVSTSTFGCKDSITRTLTVRPQPVAGFTITNNDQCLSGNSFVFSNASTGAATYSWNFGDAGTSAATAPTHSYSTAGTFTVKLVSTSSFGCKDSTTRTVTVRPQPVAGFTINNNDQCLSGNSFVFSNGTTGAATYSWNFGDAATSTATAPSHSYSVAGTFTVKLVSTSSFGCKDSISRTLTVRPQPVTSFTINNNDQCLSGNSFVFFKQYNRCCIL